MTATTAAPLLSELLSNTAACGGPPVREIHGQATIVVIGIREYGHPVGSAVRPAEGSSQRDGMPDGAPLLR